MRLKQIQKQSGPYTRIFKHWHKCRLGSKFKINICLCLLPSPSISETFHCIWQDPGSYKSDSTILGHIWEKFHILCMLRKRCGCTFLGPAQTNDLDRWLGLLLTTTNHACTLCSTTLAHDDLSLSCSRRFFRGFSRKWSWDTTETCSNNIFCLFVCCLIWSWVSY